MPEVYSKPVSSLFSKPIETPKEIVPIIDKKQEENKSSMSNPFASSENVKNNPFFSPQKPIVNLFSPP